MDIVIRSLAIIVELVILIALFYFILNGVRLIIFDFGLRQKYSKIIAVFLMAVGCIIAIFLISHLTAFYPEI
jgi:succinate dehydrogenase/fumarate reductase cytochrome b subunit